MIPAAGHGRGPGSDGMFLDFLKRKSSKWGVKDSGFDGEGVSQLDIVPPIRRGGNIVDPQRKAGREFVDQARLDGVYGQRWKDAFRK